MTQTQIVDRTVFSMFRYAIVKAGQLKGLTIA